MPREGAIVEVGALRRLAKWLERRIGLPFGIEEGRREHGDPLALPERAAHVLAPPVVFAWRELESALNQFTGELAPLPQSHQRGRVEIVGPVPLIQKFLIQQHSEVAEEHRVHVGVHAPIIVQHQNAEQIAVAIDARVTLAVDPRVVLERRIRHLRIRIVNAKCDM